jgi:hypothetical protein
MTNIRNAGRIAGALLFAQGIGGFMVNFVLLQPAIDPPGFIVNAAPHAVRVGAAALLGILVGALALAIAIAVLPVLRKFSERMALSFIALGSVGLALAAVESGTMMSLLSLSKAYVESGADVASFDGLRRIVAASRNWAHYTNLVISGLTLAIFYVALFRFALIPRALAAFGLLAVALQIVTISRPFFGAPVVFFLLAPLGLANLSVALWLLIKDFPDRST